MCTAMQLSWYTNLIGLIVKSHQIHSLPYVYCMCTRNKSSHPMTYEPRSKKNDSLKLKNKRLQQQPN